MKDIRTKLELVDYSLDQLTHGSLNKMNDVWYAINTLKEAVDMLVTELEKKNETSYTPK
jgi:hypothetical protein